MLAGVGAGNVMVQHSYGNKMRELMDWPGYPVTPLTGFDYRDGLNAFWEPSRSHRILGLTATLSRGWTNRKN
jgi:hypothetical protein